jgi:hypothetical protein
VRACSRVDVVFDKPAISDGLAAVGWHPTVKATLFELAGSEDPTILHESVTAGWL